MTTNIIYPVLQVSGDPVPGIPFMVEVEPMDTELLVTWNAASSPQDSPVTGYHIRYTELPSGTPVDIQVGLVLEYTITGLTNDVTYAVEVAAENSSGIGEYSPPVNGTPEAVPSQVTNLVLTTPVDFEIHAEWGAAIILVLATAIDSYTVEYKKTSNSIWTSVNVGLALTYDIVGLDAGEQYDVRVYASNGAGDGPYSVVETATPTGLPVVPGQVTGLVLTVPVDLEIKATWNAVVSVPIVTSYTVEHKESSSGTWIAVNVGLALSYDLIGLIAGTAYDFRVYATNADGDGPASVAETQIAEDIPAQITNLSASVGDIEQSNLQWTPPASFPAITSYICQLKLSSSSTWINFIGIAPSASSQIIYSLANSQYDFRIAAVNSRGSAPFSFIPSATPNAIGVNRVGLFDETGIDVTTPVTNWNNAGSKGGAWNLNQTFGNQNNLTAATIKGKPCLLTNGGAGLRTSVNSAMFQSYSIIACIAPNNLTGTRKYLANDEDGAFTYQQISNSQVISHASSDLALNVSVPESGEETIVTSLFSAGASNIRVTSNNGPTDANTTGNCGNNGFTLSTILWNLAQSGDADFKGYVFELRMYDGVIDGSNADAIIGAMQQKWWNNYPYIEV